MKNLNREELIRRALEVQKNAYAPYSGYHVSAAVLADSGEIYTGVIPGNDAAKKLYESMGFRETGLFENGMLEMRLSC